MAIHGFPGGVISATAPTISPSGASGVWTLDDQLQAGGNWPVTPALVDRSLRFRSSASAYLNRTPATTTNRQTWTWSGWVKRGVLGARQEITTQGDLTSFFVYFRMAFVSNGNIDIADYDGSNYQIYLRTTQVFRDPSAWYHIALAVDTTQATNTNRVKLYVNGSQVTSFTAGDASTTYPTQNYNTSVNTTQPFVIGRLGGASSFYFDGYLTEINFIDGQALTPNYFGATSVATGAWQPATYRGTYGTNGFYLPFTNITSTTTLGNDFSGNGNNWTTNNFSLTAGVTYDSMTDVPTLTSATVANYCVLSPLAGDVAPTNGNLYVTGVDKSTLGTVGVSTGKWYFEMTCVSNVATTNNDGVGIGNCAINNAAPDKATYIYRSSGVKLQTGGSNTSYGASFTTGDVIGVAYDADAGSLTFYKNNTSQGVAFTGITGTMLPLVYSRAITSTPTLALNFGQQPFIYTPPTGLVALNTFNLPTPSIGATASTQANKYMDVVLYAGTGASNTITNGGFTPSLNWTKARNKNDVHLIVDQVRGGNKTLIPSNGAGATGTDAEGTYSVVTSFNSNGVTLGADPAGLYNASGYNYVAWQWAGNGTGVTNTDGSITSTVSANTSAGFSVVTYTGTGANATVGHGLGVAPKMVIVKRRDTVDDWFVYNQNIGNTNYLRLNSNVGSATFNFWQNTNPTSSVFSISSDVSVNASGSTYVAYCFSEIASYSSIGSYTGNGSSDGTFVYTGFKPRYILIKRSSTGSGDWCIYDTAINTYNLSQSILRAQNSGGQIDSDTLGIDILSNGFKLRFNNTDINSSGLTYTYLAFAESPFKYANAR